MSSVRWDNVYAREGKRWGDAPGELARIAVARLSSAATRGLRILEVGCGYGRDAVYLAEQLGAHVVGIDPAASGLAIARRRAVPSRGTVEYRQATVEDVSDGPYAALFVSNVYHGLRPAERSALRAAVPRLLSPGGLLVLSTLAVGDPTHYGCGAPVPNDPESFAGHTYLHFSSPTSLRAEFGGRFLFERVSLSAFHEPHDEGPGHDHVHVIMVARLLRGEGEASLDQVL